MGSAGAALRCFLIRLQGWSINPEGSPSPGWSSDRVRNK